MKLRSQEWTSPLQLASPRWRSFQCKAVLFACGRSVVQCSHAMDYLLWTSWVTRCSFCVRRRSLHHLALEPFSLPGSTRRTLAGCLQGSSATASPSPPPALGPQPRPLDASPPGLMRPGPLCEAPPCSLSSSRTTSPPQSLRLRGAHRPPGTERDAA